MKKRGGCSKPVKGGGLQCGPSVALTRMTVLTSDARRSHLSYKCHRRGLGLQWLRLVVVRIEVAMSMTLDELGGMRVRATPLRGKVHRTLPTCRVDLVEGRQHRLGDGHAHEQAG